MNAKVAAVYLVLAIAGVFEVGAAWLIWNWSAASTHNAASVVSTPHCACCRYQTAGLPKNVPR